MSREHVAQIFAGLVQGAAGSYMEERDRQRVEDEHRYTNALNTAFQVYVSPEATGDARMAALKSVVEMQGLKGGGRGSAGQKQLKELFTQLELMRAQASAQGAEPRDVNVRAGVPGGGESVVTGPAGAPSFADKYIHDDGGGDVPSWEQLAPGPEPQAQVQAQGGPPVGDALFGGGQLERGTQEQLFNEWRAKREQEQTHLSRIHMLRTMAKTGYDPDNPQHAQFILTGNWNQPLAVLDQATGKVVNYIHAAGTVILPDNRTSQVVTKRDGSQALLTYGPGGVSHHDLPFRIASGEEQKFNSQLQILQEATGWTREKAMQSLLGLTPQDPQALHTSIMIQLLPKMFFDGQPPDEASVVQASRLVAMILNIRTKDGEGGEVPADLSPELIDAIKGLSQDDPGFWNSLGDITNGLIDYLGRKAEDLDRYMHLSKGPPKDIPPAGSLREEYGRRVMGSDHVSRVR